MRGHAVTKDRLGREPFSFRFVPSSQGSGLDVPDPLDKSDEELVQALTGSYPDIFFLRKLKNYYAGCFFPFHSLSKSQCF